MYARLRPLSRTALVLLVVAGCGGGDAQPPMADAPPGTPDAPVGGVDAGGMIDAAGVDPDAGGGGGFDAAPFSVALFATDPASPASDATPDVLGAAGGGCVSVEIYAEGTTVLAAGSVSAGDFTINVAVPPNATTLLSARCFDGSGNASEVSDTLGYTHDDVAPPAPSIAGTSPSPPAMERRPTVSGLVGSPDCALVEIHAGGIVYGAGAPTGGTFAVALATDLPADATTTIYARCVDLAGNVSPDSGGFAYTHQTTAPPAPTITATSPASPSSDQTPLVLGTATPGCLTVEVWENGVALLGSAAPMGATFEVPVTVDANSTTDLRARCVLAGDVLTGFSGPWLYTHDDIPPAPPPTISTVTPASPSNDATPTLGGSAPTPDCVTVDVRDYATLAVVASGPVSGGTWSLDVPVTPNTTSTLAARCVDAAGNQGVYGLEISYTHDGVAPTVPSITGTTPASPSSDDTPVVSGNRGSSGADCAVVEVWNDTTTWLNETPTTSSSWSVTVTVPTNVTTPLRARCRDLAGNTSPYTPPLAYVHDNTIPTPPTITGTTPASPAASMTPTVNGTTMDPNCVNVDVSVNGFSQGQVMVAGGTWSMMVFVVSSGGNAITARCRNAAGTYSDYSAPFTYTLDATAPSPPPNISSTPASASNDQTPDIHGTGVSADCNYVDVYNTTAMPAVLLGTATSSGGNWSVNVTVPANATTTLSVKCRDLAGNASAYSIFTLSYTHDNVAPSTPTITGTNPASPSSNNTPQVQGTIVAGCGNVEIWNGTATMLAEASVTATATTFAVATPVPTNTTTFLRARCRDAAGNTSSYSTIHLYTHDSIAPDAPVVVNTTPASPSSSTSPTVAGTSPSDCATLELWNTAGVHYTPDVSGTGGSWMKTVVVPSGPTTFRALCRDAAGNPSVWSNELTYTNDITAPTPPPSITGFTPAGGTGELFPTVSGNQPSDCVFVEVIDEVSLILHASGASTGTTWSLTFTTAANTGSRPYKARCRDAAGNFSAYGVPVNYDP